MYIPLSTSLSICIYVNTCLERESYCRTCSTIFPHLPHLNRSTLVFLLLYSLKGNETNRKKAEDVCVNYTCFPTHIKPSFFLLDISTSTLMAFSFIVSFSFLSFLSTLFFLCVGFSFPIFVDICSRRFFFSLSIRKEKESAKNGVFSFWRLNIVLLFSLYQSHRLSSCCYFIGIIVSQTYRKEHVWREKGAEVFSSFFESRKKKAS